MGPFGSFEVQRTRCVSSPYYLFPLGVLLAVSVFSAVVGVALARGDDWPQAIGLVAAITVVAGLIFRFAHDTQWAVHVVDIGALCLIFGWAWTDSEPFRALSVLPIAVGMAGLIGYRVYHSWRADWRLPGLPTPASGETVLLEVRPAPKFVFIRSVLVLGVALGCAIALYFAMRPPGDRLSPSLGFAGIAFAGTIGSAAAKKVLWYLTNFRRTFVWFSAEGVGYLPADEHDPGYRRWDEVEKFAYRRDEDAWLPADNSGTPSYWVTSDEWTITPTNSAPSVVSMFPGIRPSYKEVFTLVMGVAPDVETDCPNPWNDVSPQWKVYRDMREYEKAGGTAADFFARRR
ncbi:MAG: hypothetical protein QM728_01790 [Gordonia sp. (in: high G+C Gram-positive bacteria)]|uniref:hypothetical protein n=1 Tax=Gordonia sp. (in: high G+C Gram-positive bacteria) TaxID=84139 RepID=UPI0039E6D778